MNEQKIHELWGHVHWLTVLDQQGSFTAAAARLGVSKAAMSQRIAELERLAGVALVQRTTRSVRLTEAGQRLAEQARPAFDQIAQSVAQVRDLAGAPRGLIRLTAPVALARQQLVPLLAEFQRQHPEVRLELNQSGSDRVSHSGPMSYNGANVLLPFRALIDALRAAGAKVPEGTHRAGAGDTANAAGLHGET